MRLGDVAQLRRSDIKFSVAPAGTPIEGLNMAVTFFKSKTARHIGPHTVHTFIPRVWTPCIVDFLNTLEPDQPIFPMASPRESHIAAATASLKVVDQRLEARSLRRGSLQTMASAGTSFELMLSYSGHKTKDSLLRYLNWGSIVGAHETRLATAGVLLAPVPARTSPVV
jgi:hypothetical protein